MNIGRPTRAYIDLNALDQNLARVREKTGGTDVLGVVKADAYGHGAVEVAKRLVEGGVRMLGVALVEEGAELRDSGIDRPILVLGGFFPEQADDIVAYRLSPAVYTPEQADALSSAADRAGVTVPVHLKVDTGMGRVGLTPDEAAVFGVHLAGLSGITLEGLMTHLSDAGGPDKAFAKSQVDAFLSVYDRLKAAGIEMPFLHAAGSAAIIDFVPACFNIVRPGIMLYGCHPSDHTRGMLDLKPVMSVKTKVVYIKKIVAGAPVSYGRTWRAGRGSVIATLPIGYADGFSRRLSNCGSVLIGGRRCPVVGTVCMDLVMVDVTGLDGVDTGSEAVIIGRQGAEEITADEVASLTGTISYEVLCGISGRVPREYIY